MANLEEQFNEQILKGTVLVNDQNLQQALIETAVLDDLNDVNISSPTDGQALGYQASTNSWQNITVNIPNGDKGDITTSGGGSTWTIDNDVVTNAKLANMATATVKGRATAGTGDPEDLAIDNDLSTVSASDDTIPSAKAVKAYVDILDLKTKVTNAGLLNGFIRVTVASNNLTVAISTSASSQVDPTATNPVYVWIGDTLRSITGALSIAANAGTNWFNSGSSELATKEIDYFVYIGYNATDGVVLGYARIPYARLYSDFNTTNTNARYARISTITNAAAGDNYINIGRFAATLSAGAGYTWTVPTFTNANLIQEPIYETRTLRFVPTFSPFTTMTFTKDANELCTYQISGNKLGFYYGLILTLGTTADPLFKVSLPMSASTGGATGLNPNVGIATGVAEHNNGTGGQCFIEFGTLNELTLRNEGANYPLGQSHHRMSIQYLIS